MHCASASVEVDCLESNQGIVSFVFVPVRLEINRFKMSVFSDVEVIPFSTQATIGEAHLTSGIFLKEKMSNPNFLFEYQLLVSRDGSLAV